MTYEIHIFYQFFYILKVLISSYILRSKEGDCCDEKKILMLQCCVAFYTSALF